MSSILKDDDVTLAYSSRCSARQFQLMMSTMNFVEYFVKLGDDQSTAEAKVTEVSTEVAAYLYAYVLGNKQPLIDGIDSSTLPFMDANAKSQLIQDLLS
jgi:hypothetical protein